MPRTSPASASMPEIDAICRRARTACSDTGAAVEEIAFDVSDGRDPYKTWRGAWMVGQQFARLAHARRSSARICKGNVEGRAEGHARSISPKPEHTRQRLFHRFRELFERFDILLTPAAPVQPYPVEMNFPNEINGREIRQLHRLDRAGIPHHARRACRPAVCPLARLATDCRSACRSSRRGSRNRAFCRWPSSSKRRIRSDGRRMPDPPGHEQDCY